MRFSQQERQIAERCLISRAWHENRVPDTLAIRAQTSDFFLSPVSTGSLCISEYLALVLNAIDWQLIGGMNRMLSTRYRLVFHSFQEAYSLYYVIVVRSLTSHTLPESSELKNLVHADFVRPARVYVAGCGPLEFPVERCPLSLVPIRHLKTTLTVQLEYLVQPSQNTPRCTYNIT